MYFEFMVKVEVERTEGKFASKGEIAEQIVEALEGADPQSYYCENGGQYETVNFEVEEFVQPKAKKGGKRA